MAEYIVRETGYPGMLTQEIVGELVRCKDCKHWEEIDDSILLNYLIKGCPVEYMCFHLDVGTSYDFYCADGEREDDV